MELLTYDIKQDEVVIAPVGDLQYTGHGGYMAEEALKKHIDKAVLKGAYFIGTGDFLDSLSPSNRQRLLSAGLYDTAIDVFEKAMNNLAIELYEQYFKVTTGRFITFLEGHHFYSFTDGSTTDTRLAKMLNCKFGGTSSLVRVRYGNKLNKEVVILCSHSNGGTGLLGSPLNKLEKIAAGWDIDLIITGHNNKLVSGSVSRLRPNWDSNKLKDSIIKLVSAGSFSQSYLIGNKVGKNARGGYAEQSLMTPLPVGAPLITLCKDGSIEVTN